VSDVASGDLTTAAFDAWVRRFAALVAEHRDELTTLDSAIGDADHGTNMDRGLKAVVAALDETQPATPKALFTQVGMTLVSTVGGASGPLFGTFFLRLGGALGDADQVSPDDFVAALRAGLEGVVARGKAEPGDKTMYDALAPAVDALDAAVGQGDSLAEALAKGRGAAAAGRDATIPLQARKGRASYLGERSIGHQDPGATTMTLLFQAATEGAF
jgi:phosphoenolpyruvate---glycerone phosphotransferase subunit DhaL